MRKTIASLLVNIMIFSFTNVLAGKIDSPKSKTHYGRRTLVTNENYIRKYNYLYDIL